MIENKLENSKPRKKRTVVAATNSIREDEQESFYSLDDSIGYNVRLFTRKLRQRILTNFKDRGIKASIEEWICLAFLFRFEDVNQYHLGDILMQDKTAVTRLLDTLEKKNMVRRLIDKKDKRNRILKLTANGKRTYKALRPIVEITIIEAKRGIDEKDYQTTINTLKKLTDNLEIF